ncbi:MAG: hypothetical protein CMK07_13625 [Ponticaulis sp.]|nr:hypothetical protein [Ponticaulis sp.]MAP95982.1 hypothetical protein [Ponticaulis sp.]|tara:strand:+ start:3039 stop:4055 length:1017 start_codon:yes stop_codon:yes gene_type:complete
MPDFSFLDTQLDIKVVDEEVEVIDLQGEIDPRIKLLSHSSRNLLHACPRKYELYKLKSNSVSTDPEREQESEVTLNFGSVVGVGIQSVIEGKSFDRAVLDCFLEWEIDLDAATERQNKSYYRAIYAVKKFYDLYTLGAISDYELVYYKGKPACELSFNIILPNGYRYRGFLDVVLRHKETGEIIVLELKTSSGIAQPAMFQNSGQAIGYSVVLDELFPELSSYSVYYLVYETRSYEYKPMHFMKSLSKRAQWLSEMLLDIEKLELYHKSDLFPMHGESCYSFGRPCEYLGICEHSNLQLTKPYTNLVEAYVKEDEGKYQFNVDFETLIERQLEKTSEH